MGQVAIVVKCAKPVEDWVKVKHNGASFNNHEGLQWDLAHGFSRAIGVTTSVMMKLWVLGDGLQL